VDGADLVVLAGPMAANIDLLASVVTDAVVTDVTGVKRPLVNAAPGRLRFVGGHPMAGREHAGPGSASSALFRGAPWILCNDKAAPTDLDFVADIMRAIGANPVVMTAATHDSLVAEVSHVPHLLAVVLTNLAADNPDAFGVASGSFRDLTRVAGGDAGWWPELLNANSDEIAGALDRLIAKLADLQTHLSTGDVSTVRATLDAARRTRLGMGPALARIQVVLQDRPGEIAAVGRALGASRVDVRDLQLRHAEHGGGGILTLSVRPGEAETLRLALAGEGFALE
jgi:prephenate dehydrogenase